MESPAVGGFERGLNRDISPVLAQKSERKRITKWQEKKSSSR